jgi:rhodanese-related sulfurtransferase
MLEEALTYVAELGRKSAAPQRLDIKDPRHAVFALGGGAIQTIDLPVPPRAHAVKQLADIVELADRFDAAGRKVAVWYDECAVVLVIDDDGHRVETATLTLVESDVFKVVRLLTGGTKAASFDHKAFVRLLRIDLAGALAPSELLEVVRRVKFEAGSVVNSDVRRSRESLGREITAAVSAEAEIPDDVTLSAPVYKTFGEESEYPVRCTVEVDAMAGSFRLIPFPDEIERVQHLAVASIAERLAAGLPEGVPHYYGKP